MADQNTQTRKKLSVRNGIVLAALILIIIPGALLSLFEVREPSGLLIPAVILLLSAIGIYRIAKGQRTTLFNWATLENTDHLVARSDDPKVLQAAREKHAKAKRDKRIAAVFMLVNLILVFDQVTKVIGRVVITALVSIFGSVDEAAGPIVLYGYLTGFSPLLFLGSAGLYWRAHKVEKATLPAKQTVEPATKPSEALSTPGAHRSTVGARFKRGAVLAGKIVAVLFVLWAIAASIEYAISNKVFVERTEIDACYETCLDALGQNLKAACFDRCSRAR